MKNIKLTMAVAAAFMAMGTMVGCSDENSSSAPISTVSEAPSSSSVAVMEGFEVASNADGRCVGHPSPDDAVSLAKEAATVDYATAEATENGAHIVLPPFTTYCGYEMEFKYGMSNDTLYVTSKAVNELMHAKCSCITAYEFDVQLPFEIIGYLYYEEKVYKVLKMVKDIHPVENPILE